MENSQSRRRLIVVTTATYPTTGAYFFLKLLKEPQDEVYIDQRATKIVSEFLELINDVKNISMGPGYGFSGIQCVDDSYRANKMNLISSR